MLRSYAFQPVFGAYILVVLILAGGEAQGQEKKEVALADFKGKWTDSERYDGGLLILPLTVDDKGKVSYTRTFMKAEKIEQSISANSTQIEKKGKDYVVKLLEGIYRCNMKDKDSLEM